MMAFYRGLDVFRCMNSTSGPSQNVLMTVCLLPTRPFLESPRQRTLEASCVGQFAQCFLAIHYCSLSSSSPTMVASLLLSATLQVAKRRSHSCLLCRSVASTESSAGSLWNAHHSSPRKTLLRALHSNPSSHSGSSTERVGYGVA